MINMMDTVKNRDQNNRESLVRHNTSEKQCIHINDFSAGLFSSILISCRISYPHENLDLILT